MSDDIEFVVEMTREEAVAFVMLKHSGLSDKQGWAAQQVLTVAQALYEADRTLDADQYAMWAKLNHPTYSLAPVRT